MLVWVWNMVHYEVPVWPSWRIWHVGHLEGPSNSIHLTFNQHRSPAYFKLPASVLCGNWQKTASLAICPQLGQWRSTPFSCSGNPPDWKQPVGTHSDTWLRAIEADLKLLNIGLSSAWKKATIRENWRSVVITATLVKSMPWEEEQCLLGLDLSLAKLNHICLSLAAWTICYANIAW